MGERRIIPQDPEIGREALAALRAARVGHDHVDVRARLAEPIFREVTSVLRQLGAEWHAGRKLFVFTASWRADVFDGVLRTGHRPETYPFLVVALKLPGHPEFLCVPHGAGGLLEAGRRSLERVVHRIIRATEDAGEPSTLVHFVWHARGQITASASLAGAAVREPTQIEIGVFTARRAAHRASRDHDRSGHPGVSLDVGIELSRLLDAGQVEAFERLAGRHPRFARTTC